MRRPPARTTMLAVVVVAGVTGLFAWWLVQQQSWQSGCETISQSPSRGEHMSVCVQSSPGVGLPSPAESWDALGSWWGGLSPMMQLAVALGVIVSAVASAEMVRLQRSRSAARTPSPEDGGS